MSKRFLVSLSLSLACALILAACGGSEAPANNSSTANASNKTTTSTTTTNTTSTPAATTTTPAATTNTASSTTTTTGSGEKIGVPECDDFITKYEACVTSKIPEAARAQFNTTLKQWRDSWRQAAATSQGKAQLVQICKTSAEQSRQSMKSFGCDF